VPGVHRLGSDRVNWYLVEDAGRFTAVDAGLPGFKATLESDLAQLGARPEQIEALILTHSDPDHIGLARELSDLGARVLVHSADEPRLRKPGPKSGDGAPIKMIPELWRPSLWMMGVHLVRNGGARTPGVTGAETFGGEGALDVPGRPRVIPTPGHTVGHCAFYFEGQRALFAGDALCTWNPMTGGRGPQLLPRSFQESARVALSSLGALEPIEADVVLFGHGDPWTGGAAAAVSQARANSA